jgi:hypothetical protein
MSKRTEIVHCEPVGSISLIEKAIASGIDVTALGRLVDLHERVAADTARREFIEAMTAAKAEVPSSLEKTRQVNAGPVKYKHVTLYDLCNVVGPILASHGLAYRWDVDQPSPKIVCVTCVISHVGGHIERVTIHAPADEGRGRNPVQCIGSTITYLQRYTLKSAIGIAEADQDSDGRSEDEPATTAQIDRLYDLRDDDRVSDAGRERIAKLLEKTDIRTREAQSYIAGAVKAIERRTGEPYSPQTEKGTENEQA